MSSSRDGGARTVWLYAATIFTSAFLLFLVQPIMAKQILPWFGGSAAVWSVCMVFFQVTLLAGYAYADAVVRHLRPRAQARLHGALLLASLATLPIVAAERWKPAPGDEPTVLILALLLATIGLPYFLLSTTGPLLQAWLARTPWGARVYRYFSLSNFASLLALLAYPLLLEPHWPLRDQAVVWSAGFGAFVVLALVVAWRASKDAPGPTAVAVGAGPASTDASAALAPSAPSAPRAPTAPEQPALWLALPALGSWLLIAVTNHLTHNVASIPFLWVLPLVTYLVTFILCFESDRWYRRMVFLPLAAATMLAAAWSLLSSGGEHLSVALPLHLGLLFVLCMVLHGETARLRPAPQRLTRFYLMLSAGGALGGAFVGLGAPFLFAGYYELGLGLVLTALVGIAAFAASRRAVWACVGLALVLTALLHRQVVVERQDARRIERNFYGTLQTYDLHRTQPIDDVRVLLHGSIKHGEQYLAPARAREATAYYGVSSGVGRLLRSLPAGRPARIGLIGLGAGTLAVYARPGDAYRLYEIDPEVFTLAHAEFSFLRDSPARFEQIVGDARLSLEREAPQRLDVLVIDAFSGGSIPVHLLTLQALDVYTRHLAPEGVLAFHVTNRHLDLPPVLLAAARERGLHAVLLHDDAEDSDLRRTDWLLMAREPARLQLPALQAIAKPAQPAARAWSDDFNDLLGILK